MCKSGVSGGKKSSSSDISMKKTAATDPPVSIKSISFSLIYVQFLIAVSKFRQVFRILYAFVLLFESLAVILKASKAL